MAAWCASTRCCSIRRRRGRAADAGTRARVAGDLGCAAARRQRRPPRRSAGARAGAARRRPPQHPQRPRRARAAVPAAPRPPAAGRGDWRRIPRERRRHAVTHRRAHAAHGRFARPDAGRAVPQQPAGLHRQQHEPAEGRRGADRAVRRRGQGDRRRRGRAGDPGAERRLRAPTASAWPAACRPSRPSEPARQATGKVQATVDDKKAADCGQPDKLTLSQGGVQGWRRKQQGRPRKPRTKDAAARVAELTRNVEELKKLQRGAGAAPKPRSDRAAPAPAAAPAARRAGAAAAAAAAGTAAAAAAASAAARAGARAAAAPAPAPPPVAAGTGAGAGAGTAPPPAPAPPSAPRRAAAAAARRRRSRGQAAGRSRRPKSPACSLRCSTTRCVLPRRRRGAGAAGRTGRLPLAQPRQRKDERRDLVPRKPPAARFVLRRQRRPAHRHARRRGRLVVDELFAEPARRDRRRRSGGRGRRLPGLRPRPAGRGDPQGSDAQQPGPPGDPHQAARGVCQAARHQGLRAARDAVVLVDQGEGDDWPRRRNWASRSTPTTRCTSRAARPSAALAGGATADRSSRWAPARCRSRCCRRRRSSPPRRATDSVAPAAEQPGSRPRSCRRDGAACQAAGEHATDRPARRRRASNDLADAPGRPAAASRRRRMRPRTRRRRRSTSARSRSTSARRARRRRATPALDYSSMPADFDDSVAKSAGDPSDPLRASSNWPRSSARSATRKVRATCSKRSWPRPAAPLKAKAQSMLDGLA